MIILKSPREIEEMKPASQIVADCYREVAKLIGPGITTREINDFVARHITKLGGKQFTKGYNGFPAETCISVNDVVAHGIPSNQALMDGDLLKLDIVVEYGGWFGDSCWCYAVGNIRPEAQKLMKVTKECLIWGSPGHSRGPARRHNVGDSTACGIKRVFGRTRSAGAWDRAEPARGAKLRAYRRSRQRHSVKGRHGVYD